MKDASLFHSSYDSPLLVLRALLQDANLVLVNLVVGTPPPTLIIHPIAPDTFVRKPVLVHKKNERQQGAVRRSLFNAAKRRRLSRRKKKPHHPVRCSELVHVRRYNIPPPPCRARGWGAGVRRIPPSRPSPRFSRSRVHAHDDTRNADVKATFLFQ